MAHQAIQTFASSRFYWTILFVSEVFSYGVKVITNILLRRKYDNTLNRNNIFSANNIVSGCYSFHTVMRNCDNPYIISFFPGIRYSDEVSAPKYVRIHHSIMASLNLNIDLRFFFVCFLNLQDDIREML